MSKKSKKQAKRGTFALCLTAGLAVGAGLGPFAGDMLFSVVIFGLLGIGAGWVFTHRARG